MGLKGKEFRNKAGDDKHTTHKVFIWEAENGIH